MARSNAARLGVRVERWRLAVPALALLAVLGLAGASSRSSSSSGTATANKVAAEIHDIASRFEWPLLPDFLVDASWTESRWNPAAQNAAGRAGAFQLLASSALVDDLASFTRSDLFDLPFAVVAAADYTQRLRKYRGSRPESALTGLDLRRGWAYPTLVDDYAESEQRSRDVRARLAQAERATGLRVADRLMFPAGWKWIGVPAALHRAGVA